MKYHNLIIKFFAEEISDSEIIELKAWLDLDIENRRIFNEENELWQEASVHTKLEYFNPNKAWVNISSRLRIEKNKIKHVKLLDTNNLRILIAAAAVVCLVAIGSLILYIRAKTSFDQMVAAVTMITTKEGEKAHITLPDSTDILLNSGSTLQYNGQFNLKERIVKFSGEAFFNISINRDKPFVVQLDNMSISAKGTRFNVFFFGNENRIETTLEEGIIDVSIKGKKPISVKPGQQVVYFVKSDKVLVHDVAIDTYTSWKENKLRFNDTPFEEVLRRIGRKYNVKFEITNRDLLNLKYTGTFIDVPIEEVMQMLKTVSPITYKIYYFNSVKDPLYKKPKIVVWKRNST